MRKLKFFRSLTSRGLYGTIHWIFHGYFVFNNFIVFYRNLENPVQAPAPSDGVEIKKLSLDALCSIRKGRNDLPVEFFCDKTHGLTTPFVALVEGELAAIHWLVQPGETSRFLSLSEGDIELNLNTVLPEFRGNRLAELLMVELLTDCKNNNLKRMFGVVHVSNIPQYKQMMRLGFEPVEHLTHFAFYRPKATLRYVS